MRVTLRTGRKNGKLEWQWVVEGREMTRGNDYPAWIHAAGERNVDQYVVGGKLDVFPPSDHMVAHSQTSSISENQVDFSTVKRCRAWPHITLIVLLLYSLLVRWVDLNAMLPHQIMTLSLGTDKALCKWSLWSSLQGAKSDVFTVRTPTPLITSMWRPSSTGRTTRTQSMTSAPQNEISRPMTAIRAAGYSSRVISYHWVFLSYSALSLDGLDACLWTEFQSIIL